MTLNTFIDVYFHMKNHYKKLKHVKSVIDCSPPKGRPRKESPHSSEIPGSKYKDRSRSSTRPPTRRNLNDMPQEKSKSLGRSEASYSNDVELYDTKVHTNSGQHEYLQFSLRITEDIIKNDLYTNDQMKQVLMSHFEANKGRLDTSKMVAALYELCKELNIPICEAVVGTNKCHVTPSSNENSITACICQSTHKEYKIKDCECATDRLPPINCLLHTSTQNESRLKIDGMSTAVLEVNIVQTPKQQSVSNSAPITSEEMSFEINSTCVIHCSNDPPEIEVLHKPEELENSVSSSLNLDDQGDSKPQSSSDENLQNKTQIDVKQVAKTTCACGSPSCNPSSCEMNGHESPLIKGVASSVIMLDTDSHKYKARTPYNSLEVKTTMIPESHDNSSQKIEEDSKQADISCDENNLETCIDYFKEKHRPTHVHQLAYSHYITSIEPVSKQTADLSIQTSFDQLKPTRPKCDNKETNTDPDSARTPDYNFVPTKQIMCNTVGTQFKSELLQAQNDFINSTYNLNNPKTPICISKQSALCTESAQNEFIIFDGPIFIPKVTVNSNELLTSSERIKTCFDDHSCQPVQMVCAKKKAEQPLFKNFTSQTSPVNPKPIRPGRQSLINESRYNHEVINKCRCKNCPQETKFNKLFNDYDVTPQREILKYDNYRDCGHGLSSQICKRTNNLLLGNEYDKYYTSNGNLSHFYPTIATQVSSMDLLNYQPTYELEQDPAMESRKQQKLTLELFQSDVDKKMKSAEIYGKQNAQQRSNDLKLVNNESTNLDDVILQGFTQIPRVSSSDSMERRIQILKHDLERFRDGDTEYLPTIPKIGDEQPRERGVSISDEVELIKHSDINRSAYSDSTSGSKDKRDSMLK